MRSCSWWTGRRGSVPRSRTSTSMMGLVPGMALWSSRRVSAVALVVATALVPSAALAQAVSPAERDALVRLRTDRGGKPEDVDALLKRADAASAAGLPAGPLVNKIREGLAKGYEPARIDAVVQQMVGNLGAADTALGARAPGLPPAGRDAAVALLAEAIAGGVTPGDIAELRRQVQPGGAALTTEGVA